MQNLADELNSRGVLGSFDLQEYLPPLLSVRQCLGILGATWSQWIAWHAHNSKPGTRHSKYLPKPVIGSTYSQRAEYAAKDILQVLKSPKRFSDSAPLFPEETVRAFEDYVRASAERVLYDWSSGLQKEVIAPPTVTVEAPSPPVKVKSSAAQTFVGWPDGVPRDYNALVREYRPFVERTLNRYVKPCSGQSIEDVKQHIWMKLIESKTLGKFVEKASLRKIPARATAAEAVEYLGITWDQWMDLMRKDLKWLQPIEGTVYSTTALFTKDQIRNVEESGLFPIQAAIPAGDMSKVFRGYLRQVIHNHFANYCRSRVRRFIKDTVVPNDSTRVHGGSFRTALEGDMTSWEDALEDTCGLAPDASVDLPECDSVESLTDDLSKQLGLIAKSIPAARQDDVFNLIAEGYTLREAIDRVRSHTTRVQVRVA